MNEITSEIATSSHAVSLEPQPVCARAPVGLLAELTHRCPLQCPYCSNPVELERSNVELSTADWQNVMRQAAEL
ncbi:MAG: pyrroloquinoline quinone biosynthesis protein PqqE, partial [Hyphomicrobiaceae bacterium]